MKTEHLQASRLIFYANNGVKTKSNKHSYSNYITYCGFLADNGYHCVPDGLSHCAVCKEVV